MKFKRKSGIDRGVVGIKIICFTCNGLIFGVSFTWNENRKKATK